MKQKILILGSIIASVVIVLASFPTVVGHDTKPLSRIGYELGAKLQGIKERFLDNCWFPGEIIFNIIAWIIIIIGGLYILFRMWF